MASRLTDIVREIYDRTVLTKRVTALTGGTYGLAACVIAAGGSGYSDSFAVTFTGGGGSGAAGTATAVDGVIVEVDITAAGTGYTSAPTPVFTAGSGTGATGTSILAAATLDAIPTEDIEAGTLVVYVTLAELLYTYALVSGTDAESAPAVIRPDDYAGSTNEKVWKLQGTYLKAAALLDGTNIVLGTSTGSKIGTAASQKLGFWNATPVVQPASADQAVVTLGNTNGEISGLTIGSPSSITPQNTDGEIAALTFSATPTQAEAEALRDKCEDLAEDVLALDGALQSAATAASVQALQEKCEELADDVRALSTLLHSLRSAGVSSGLWKGSN